MAQITGDDVLAEFTELIANIETLKKQYVKIPISV